MIVESHEYLSKLLHRHKTFKIRNHLRVFVRLTMLLPLLFFLPLILSAKLNLSPPEGSYKILMLLPIGSQSHRNCFMPLAESLAERGHKIYMLSPLEPISKNPNIKEINHGITIIDDSLSMFEARNGSAGMWNFFKVTLPNVAEKMYDNPDVMELYNMRHEFDFIFIDEMFHETAYPFLVDKIYGSISPAGILASSSATLGNVLNPSYIPSLFSDLRHPFPFFQRFMNLFSLISFPVFWRNFGVHPLIEEKILKRFPDLPTIAETEKGLSLVLANTYFALDFPMPLLPSQIEVGGMHCRPGKPLPKNLEKFINDAGPDGVIYFSLGSVCKGKTIPETYKKILLEAFSQLKERVIWKFEDEFKDLPKNIMISKWLPQQDILAHPNVKLFITHGGLLSMQEAVYHGKPLLAIPVGGDQIKNSQKIYNKQFGKFLIWEELTVDLVKSTIQEIISDSKYKNTVEKTSASFRDQLSTPLEKAVWWTEYVIRHKGAPQLKSPGADLSWVEYLMIDILVVLHLVLFLVYWVLKKLIKLIKFKFFGSSKSVNQSQKSKKE